MVPPGLDPGTDLAQWASPEGRPRVRGRKGISLLSRDLIRRAAPFALGAALAVLASASASADPIGPDCGTCQGSTYTLNYDPTPLATIANTKTYRITLTIDSSGYLGGGVGIDPVAVKVSSMLAAGSLSNGP